MSIAKLLQYNFNVLPLCLLPVLDEKNNLGHDARTFIAVPILKYAWISLKMRNRIVLIEAQYALTTCQLVTFTSP